MIFVRSHCRKLKARRRGIPKITDPRSRHAKAVMNLSREKKELNRLLQNNVGGEVYGFSSLQQLLAKGYKIKKIRVVS